MAQAKISKNDVARVMDQLIGEGKKPTLNNIRAALGDQGSNKTILEFKREVDAEALAAKDSPEMLKSFRAIYQAAVEEGKAQRLVELEELEHTLVAISAEADQSKLEAAASRLQAVDAANRLEETVAKLNGAIGDLANAREAAERYAAKLVEAGDAHSQEINKLRDQAEVNREALDLELCQLRDQAQKVNEQHRLECDGLRQQLATVGEEHRLESERRQHQAEKAGEQHREEIKEMRGHAEKSQQQYRREIEELREHLDKEKDRANDFHVKLARAETLVETRGDAKAPEDVTESPVPNGR